MASILVLNGPNLNLLGSREPDTYGYRTLEEIMEDLTRFAGACGHELTHQQENSEGALVEAIHRAANDGVDYIIFNPAGYTHTSVALRDAMLAVRIPFIEVHLVFFRHRDGRHHRIPGRELHAGPAGHHQSNRALTRRRALSGQERSEWISEK